MRIAVKNRKDFYAGLLFMAFGALFALGATSYRMGSASRMGPGYFPLVLGILLSLLGLGVLAGSLLVRGENGDVERLRFWPAFLVLTPIGAFALLLRPAGLVVALAVLIVASSLASEEFRWKETLLNAAVLIAGSIALFVWGLHLQLPIWPAFLGR